MAGINGTTPLLQRRISMVITNVKTGQFKIVRDLRVTFSMKKSHKTVQNKASIQVYNLSEDNRKFVRESQDRAGNYYVQVEINAWHEQGEKPEKAIFKGRCLTSSDLQRPNWITTFDGVDSATNFRNFSYEKFHKKGTSIRTILNELARESGVPLKIVGKIKGSLKRGQTYSGAPLQILIDLKANYGFTFDIQDKALIVRPPDPDPTIFTDLNFGTGMIGTPVVRAGMLMVKSLINPNLVPDTFIRVTSVINTSLSGIYIIRKTTTKGDTWTGDWTMDIEASVLGVPSIYYMEEN